MPLFVTVLMLAPVKPPCRTSKGASDTCTCSTASNGTGSAFVWPPGAGSSRPNELLKYDPSSEMLLYSQLRPANAKFPSLRGSMRVKSRVLRFTDGRSDTCSGSTNVAAPVRDASDSSRRALTCTPVSCVAARASMKSTRWVSPRATTTFSRVRGSKPRRVALTM